MSKSKKKNQRRKIKKKTIKTLENFPVKTIKTSITKDTPSCNWAAFVKLQHPEKVPFKIPQSISQVKRPKRVPKKTINKVVALDCEMVSNEKDEDMLARVSVVNYRLECIYDKYVKPTSPVGDYRTKYSGIREPDLKKGEKFEIVKKEVQELLYNKILVGHALSNDFKVLKFSHHLKLIRDTSKYEPFRETSDGKSPSLKKLTKLFLDENIQKGEHDSVEDAKAAMKLYKKVRHEWEKSLLSSKFKANDSKEI